MKFLLFAALAVVANAATGIKRYKIVVEEYKNEPDCYMDDAYACLEMKSSSQIRDIWKCWMNAPQKCWYRLDLYWTIEVPPKAICKTPENWWVIDFAGYLPSFIMGADSYYQWNFYYTGVYHGTCDPYIYHSTFKGPSPVHTSAYDSCEVKPLPEGYNVPVYYMKGPTENWNYVRDTGADFISSGHDQLVLTGIDDQCYGALTGFENDDGFAHYAMFWGMKGHAQSTTTPKPTTTPIKTTTKFMSTSFISKGPVDFCKHYVVTWKEFKPDHCANLCDYYYSGGGAFWCPGADKDDGETLLECVIVMNKKVCSDSRDEDSLMALPFENDLVVEKSIIDDCHERVSSHLAEEPYTTFCHDQCDYYATIGGCKYCAGSKPSGEDLAQCVATRNEHSCAASTH